MTIGIKVLNKREFKRFIEDNKKEMTNLISKGITNSTLFIQGEVKESIAGRRAELTSVDTGRFLNSVSVQINTTKGKVFTDIPYAEFLEYGTSKMAPRRHFGNTEKRNKKQVNDIFKAEMKTI